MLFPWFPMVLLVKSQCLFLLVSSVFRLITMDPFQACSLSHRWQKCMENLNCSNFRHLFGGAISCYLSIYLSTYLSIYLSIHISMCLSIYLSIYPSFHRCICLSIHRSIYVFVYLFVYLSINQSVNQEISRDSKGAYTVRIGDSSPNMLQIPCAWWICAQNSANSTGKTRPKPTWNNFKFKETFRNTNILHVHSQTKLHEHPLIIII